jgi:L-fuconolactonase
MRIDAHQHFWQYDPIQYGWITDELAAIKRDFLPTDLAQLLARSGFDGSVAVQARQHPEETRWLLEMARENDFVKGVVGWVDLRSVKLPEQLERFAGDEKLVGVRHIVQDEPDDEFMLGTQFRRGIARLAGYGLTYDLLLHPKHLPVAVQLVREFPEQQFVLDHIAKPLIGAGALSPWAEDLRELAKFDNVWCKLSGMVTETHWKRWKPADFHPYLDVVFESFGPHRLMIGSDWPVCTLSGDYQSTIDIVTDYVSKLPLNQRDAVMGENCARFYGIE